MDTNMNALPSVARYNIDTSALLVELNTSVWTARKLDRGTTDELVVNKHAGEKGAARVNKHLLAGRTELEVIAQHVGAVRNRYVYTHTLPWSDGGARLLPSIQFMEFNQRMMDEEEKFWELVRAFLYIYPSLITAQAMALGDMFKRDDFPSVDEIKHKFAWSCNYLPVPTAGDFRVDVGNAAMQELRDRYEKFATERVDAAMQDVRLRLKEHLLRMSDRLTTDVTHGEVKVRKFNDSLLDSGLELVDIIQKLNLVGDAELENARKRLERTLLGVGVADLRRNTVVRNDVKSEVDSILSSISW